MLIISKWKTYVTLLLWLGSDRASRLQELRRTRDQAIKLRSRCRRVCLQTLLISDLQPDFLVTTYERHRHIDKSQTEASIHSLSEPVGDAFRALKCDMRV